MEFEDDFQIYSNSYQLYFFYGYQNGSDVILICKFEDNNNKKNCLVHVTGLKKTLYIKPKTRKPAEQSTCDFISSIEMELATVSNLKLLVSYKSELVRKQTIYGQNEDFLKITYNASEKFACRNYQMKITNIEYIYGLEQNAYHQFLFDKQIKGPTWIEIEIYYSGSMPRYPSEIKCDASQIKCVRDSMEMQTPTLKMISFDIAYTPIEFTNPMRVHPCFFATATGITTTEDRIQQKGETKGFIACGNNCRSDEFEYAEIRQRLLSHSKNIRSFNVTDLIKRLQLILQNEQPDIIICHELRALINPYYYHCYEMEKLFENCVVIELKVAAEEYYSAHVRNDLDSLFSYFMNDQQVYKRSNCEEWFHMLKDSEKLIEFTGNMLSSTSDLLRLADAMGVWPLLRFTSNITGCPLKEVRRCGMLKQVEYLLKFELSGSDVMIPEIKDPFRPTKAKILGPKIIEPSVGYINGIVAAFDFKSLYPSIIREYNLMLGNLSLSKLIEGLLVQREICLQEEKRNNTQSRTTTRSALVKLRLNSIYGCFSSEYSIFYCPELANRIVNYGIMTLTDLESHLSDYGKVIYGHTDSIFIQLRTNNYEVALQSATEYQEWINQKYKFIHLKLEGIYSHAMIFAKTQYVLRHHNCSNSQEMYVIKGLFRRTVSKIAQEIFKYLVEYVFQSGDPEPQREMISVIEKQYFSSNDPAHYAMHVQLKKPPACYKGTNAFEQILSRRNLEMIEGYRVQDYVSYLICNDGTPNEHNCRAYSLQEYEDFSNKSDKQQLPYTLSIDKEYYKEKQVLPFLNKLAALTPEYKFEAITCYLKRKRIAPWSKPLRLNPIRLVYPLVFQCLQCFDCVIMNQADCQLFAVCANCRCDLLTCDEQIDEILNSLTQMLAHLSQKLKRSLYSCPNRCSKVKAVTKLKCPKCKQYFIASYNHLNFFHQLTHLKEQFNVCKHQVEWPLGNRCPISAEMKVQVAELSTKLLSIVDIYAKEVLPPNFDIITIDWPFLYQP